MKTGLFTGDSVERWCNTQKLMVQARKRRITSVILCGWCVTAWECRAHRVG